MKLERIKKAIIKCSSSQERKDVAMILSVHAMPYVLNKSMEPFAQCPHICINESPRWWCDVQENSHDPDAKLILASEFIAANMVNRSTKLENIKDAVIVCETWSDREVVIRILLSSDVPVGYHEDMPATYDNHPNVCISEYPRSWTTLPSQVAYKNAPFISASEFIAENKDIENRVRNGNPATPLKKSGMTPIIRKEDPNTILTSDIDEHKHLIVAIHQGLPCIVTKGCDETSERYTLKTINRGFTKGNGYFTNPYNEPRTVGGLVEKVIEHTDNTTPIAVFKYTDWMDALQWLIDNAKP